MDTNQISIDSQKPRPDWDKYFMEIAQMVATRATCNRGTDLKYMPGFKGVGAVIARDRVILSTGYNGSPRGMEHCDQAGHELVDGHCIRTVHSEGNAVAQAAKNGISIDGATIYTTASPCYDCLKLLINAGIKKVVYSQYYDSRYDMSKHVLDLAQKAGVETACVKAEETKNS
ncbi:MAG: hypothetical protein UT11_C0063G0008 [Berkelbacteria bacterium GW2011_GWA2_38_9]|uniref:CMP/dCMP-type deaminase domain-containing protein n=1 Tax=Berkelbacteria bacterium GW2011_GWA2_38_9 TaxID=1618334 RepID=A0A0G0L454_9BACT|nr:MAG: hypothetical protein UT11_C0063G0008 [Berkelbacteria bacterium GW2011_GWA2_38_9]